MTERSYIVGAVRDRTGVRTLALGGIFVLLGAPISVLVEVTDVVGGGETRMLLVLVAVSLLASTLLARLVRPAVALVVALGLLTVGGSWYFLTLPAGTGARLSTDVLIADALALLSGLSILRITNAGQWALAATPAPVFLTWYLGVRRQYVPATVVGGGFLGLFVLTGDASLPITLFGVLGGAAAVGFGELEGRVGESPKPDVVALVLAAMVIATLTVGVVPGGAGTSLAPGSAPPGTVEASLVDPDDRIDIRGSIQLSPAVRFTVESDRPAYWKVASYDRYAGDAWVKTGIRGRPGGALEPPEGRTATVEQSFRAESHVNTMPAAWKPVELTDGSGRALVTDSGSLRPRAPLGAGDDYSVISQHLTSPPEQLRAAGTTYPGWVRDRYLQLPESTPDRVAHRTSRLTASAQNPYDTARVIQFWLKQNREYSLEVSRPDGSIADAFLFDMEAGYCTYYATTMVVMLRSQGIPARFVTGYTPGQQVDQQRWVVRGLDSHAWVEVYFPGHGWVQFDPTPADPRRMAEDTRIDTARTQGDPNVDTRESESAARSTPEEVNGTTATPSNGTQTPANLSENVTAPIGGGSISEGFGGDSLPTPSREEVGLGLVVVLGIGAAIRRSGLATAAWGELWVRRPPSGSPAEQIEGAFERLEYLLGRHSRKRRPAETHRQYLAAVGRDPRVGRVGQLYERAVFAGEASPAEAAEATRLVRELASERSVRDRLGP